MINCSRGNISLCVEMCEDRIVALCADSITEQAKTKATTSSPPPSSKIHAGTPHASAQTTLGSGVPAGPKDNLHFGVPEPRGADNAQG
jgi:hypothetical protein